MQDVIEWFRLRDRRRRVWRVHLAHPRWFAPHEAAKKRTDRYANGFAGLTILAERAIYLSASEDRSTREETLLHEVMHAVLDGFEPVRASEAISYEAEERAVSAISPRLYPVIRRMGLRWPRLPRGTAALERASRAWAQEDA